MIPEVTNDGIGQPVTVINVPVNICKNCCSKVSFFH